MWARSKNSLKTIILAGGMGTRRAEQAAAKPKPILEIGGRPLLRHVMNIYAANGFNDFIVASSYRGDVIKEYFARCHLHTTI
jgi:glucose-1-phosphate cytidylyltransferase